MEARSDLRTDLPTVTADTAPRQVEQGDNACGSSGSPIRSRPKAEIEALFDGFDLLDPGVTLVHRRHPDEQAAAIDDAHVFRCGGVAVKR